MISKIAQNTLKDLEFDRVLDQIAAYSISGPGKAAVLDLKPITQEKLLINRLHEVNEYLSSYQNNNRIPNHYFEEISKELNYLQIAGSYLEGASFLKLSTMANTVLGLLKFFEKFSFLYPSLQADISKLNYHPVLVQQIERLITPFGEVRDDASPDLLRIRKEIHAVRGKIGGSFNAALTTYISSGFLDEIKETVVDNQRVLAVAAMHRKKVNGAILGSSKTGSIVYIAPESTLHFNRELQNLQYDEQEEIIRILKKLTDETRPYLAVLTNYQDYLAYLDLIGAKAAYAREINACLPAISKEKVIRLREAYHPILLQENRKKNKKTIAQDIELKQDHRIIVISGPNAGGKSIALKTVGLLQAMLQSGLLIPVHEKSEVSFFKTMLTDIGDNQSIENHLSTYSYRLKNMRHFLQKCDEHTLFLIDEFGTGSDPELGGALAEVFLEEFYEKGSFGIITTHYANLKVLADELPEAVNANMQFDYQTLEPLYKLVTGQAGSSFTFEVAQKNGIPFRLINRAKKKVEREKIRLDKTIAKLQTERSNLQNTSHRLEKERALAEETTQKLIEKQQKIQDKINSYQELYDNNQKMLFYGRNMNQILNKYFQNNNKKELNEQIQKWIAMEQSKYLKTQEEKKQKQLQNAGVQPEKPISKRERKLLNEQVRQTEKMEKEALEKAEKEILHEVIKVRTEKKEKEKKIARTKEDYQFKVNDRVRLIDGSAKGTIEKIEKNTATINYGIFTAKTKLDQLELVEAAKN